MKNNEEMWKDSLQLLAKEGNRIISQKDIEDVIDIFISDRVDPQIFASNLEIIITGFLSPFSSSSMRGINPSPSAHYFNTVLNRAPMFPLWFYIAYPDVMKWFHERQKELSRLNNYNDDKLAVEMAEMFDIKVEDLDWNIILNKEKQCKPEYLKKLIQKYKKETKKSLETTIEKYSERDIYTGQDILDELGEESNFTLIAKTVTKFYLEIERKYKDYFTDKASLLAAAGILDAQWDIILSKKIKPEEILSIAEDSVKTDDALLNFITELEIKLLKIDASSIDIDFIKKTCEEQRDNIKKAIQEAKEKYIGEPKIISDTKIFMESDNLKQIRDLINISSKKLPKKENFFLKQIKKYQIVTLSFGFLLLNQIVNFWVSYLNNKSVFQNVLFIAILIPLAYFLQWLVTILIASKHPEGKLKNKFIRHPIATITIFALYVIELPYVLSEYWNGNIIMMFEAIIYFILVFFLWWLLVCWISDKIFKKQIFQWEWYKKLVDKTSIVLPVLYKIILGLIIALFIFSILFHLLSWLTNYGGQDLIRLQKI